jgi:outer membrane protein OmpA-like peptidoglycan-associated protein
MVSSVVGFAFWANLAHAEAWQRSPLLGMSQSEMRAQIDQRFDAAVKASQDPQIVGAPDGRYYWAQAAKAACGIAIGYLKAGQVDEDSVDKCDAYSKLMTMAPPPPAPAYVPPPPPEPTAQPCPIKTPIIFYFAWDDATPPQEAQQVAGETVSSMGVCHWTSFNVVGHTDTSGTVSYNQRLSERRAQNVAGLLTAAGAQPGALSVKGVGKSEPAVQTGDGVREPLNRRVEVSPAGGQ